MLALLTSEDRQELTTCTGTVRQLCKSMFPVSYSDKFYQDVLLPEVIEYCQLGVLLIRSHGV